MCFLGWEVCILQAVRQKGSREGGREGQVVAFGHLGLDRDHCCLELLTTDG